MPCNVRPHPRDFVDALVEYRPKRVGQLDSVTIANQVCGVVVEDVIHGNARVVQQRII